MGSRQQDGRRGTDLDGGRPPGVGENEPVEIAILLVLLAVVVIAGEALSERLGAPAPLLLTVVGIALSFVPGVPEIPLEPEIVLIGLLPPLLYTASLSTSLVDMKANLRPIMLLSVAAVLVTMVAVAVVVRALLPDVGWPVALAIGAVVAPPDAVAATAVGRRIGLPRRVVSVLEGESLLNDATALVALRTSIAAMAGGVSAGGVAGDFLLAAGGGVLVDTPGLREIGLHEVGDGLERTFPDVEELVAACRFADCGHDSEPGCAVTAALASGELDERRWHSWQKLQREAEWMARRTDPAAAAAARRRWAKIGQAGAAQGRLKRTGSPFREGRG